MNNELTVKVYLGTWPAISSPLQAATAQPLDTRVKKHLVSRDLFLRRRYHFQGCLYYAADHWSHETTTASALVLFVVAT